jgi:hypothetical protein
LIFCGGFQVAFLKGLFPVGNAFEWLILLNAREMEVPTASVSCIEYEENAVELCPWYL